MNKRVRNHDSEGKLRAIKHSGMKNARIRGQVNAVVMRMSRDRVGSVPELDVRTERACAVSGANRWHPSCAAVGLRGLPGYPDDHSGFRVSRTS